MSITGLLPAHSSLEALLRQAIAQKADESPDTILMLRKAINDYAEEEDWGGLQRAAEQLAQEARYRHLNEQADETGRVKPPRD